MSVLVLVSETLAPFGSSMTMLYEIMGTFGMFLMLSQIPMDARAVRVIGMGQAAGIVLIAVAVFIEVGWERLGTGVVRARGPMHQPNLMAEEAARVLPFALALLLDRENRGMARVLGLLAVGGALYCQFAAASRGGSLGMVLGLVVFAVASGRSAASRFGNVLVIALSIGAFVIVSPRSYDQRVLGTVRADQVDDDLTSERLSQLDFAKILIPDRPFFGWGSTGFPTMHAYRVSGRDTALHSSILSVVVAYGIPMLVLYVSIVLGGVIVGVRGIRRWTSRHLYGNAVLAAGAASFSASIAGTTLFRLPMWFPILLLYLIAHHQVLERRREGREAEDAAIDAPPPDPLPQPETALPQRT
jgi:O-antigen ligase